MRSTPSRIGRVEVALGPARVDLHAHAGVEAAGEVDHVAQACARSRRRRAASSCARSRTGRRRARASASTGASARLQRVGRFFPRQRRRRPGREHEATRRRTLRAASSARTSRPCCASHCSRFGEVERAEPDQVADVEAARRPRRRRARCRRPSRAPRASRPTRRRGRCRASAQNARSLDRATAGTSRSRSRHARAMHHAQPSVRPRAMLLPPSSCRLMPVTNSDSGLARYTAACGDIGGRRRGA